MNPHYCFHGVAMYFMIRYRKTGGTQPMTNDAGIKGAGRRSLALAAGLLPVMGLIGSLPGTARA
jgi:hypothetical protein